MAWMAAMRLDVGQPRPEVHPDDLKYLCDQKDAHRLELMQSRKTPWLNGSPFSSGIDIPFLDHLIRVTIPNDAKRLEDKIPTILSTNLGFMVPEVFIEEIEKMEPEVHRYWEVDLSFADGTRLKTKRWFVQSMSFIDTLDFEKSELQVIGRDPFDPDETPYLYSFKQEFSFMGKTYEERKKLVIPVFCKRSETTGRALWSERRLGGRMFFSDELVDALEKYDLGMLGFEYPLQEI